MTDDDRMNKLMDMMETMMISVDRSIKGLETKMDKRFDEVDKRFVEVDKRFGEMDKRFDDMDKRFGEMDKRFEELRVGTGLGFEEQGRDIKGIADGLSHLLERRADDEVWRAEMESRILKLEVDVQNLKKRISA